MRPLSRPLLLLVSVVAVPATLASAAPAGRKTLLARCPVTAPNASAPAGTFNYGNARIRAQIWPHGILVAGRLPDGSAWAEINPDGSIVAKLGWWRGVAGTLSIKGRRIDAPAPPLRVELHLASYPEKGFIPSTLTFPTVGCWRVVGSQGGASLVFVVKVTKVKSGR